MDNNFIELSGCAIVENDKLLLLFKKKHSHWEFPGGKINESETIEETALRETKEEIGCDVELGDYFGYYDFEKDGRKLRSHKFLAKIPTGQAPRVAEPEIFGGMMWLPIAEYKKYPVAPNAILFCEDYLKRKINS